MRKILCVILISLVTIPSIFSITNYGGIKASFVKEITWSETISEGTKTRTKIETDSLNFGFSGANYFGKNKSFGIGYDLGVRRDLKFLNGDTAKSVSNQIGINVSSLFLYKLDITQKLSLEMGAGISLESKTFYYKDTNVKAIEWLLEPKLQVGLLYSVSDFLILQGGVKLGLPLVDLAGTSKTVSGASSFDMCVSGFDVCGFAGLYLAY